MALQGNNEKPLPPGSMGLPIVGENLEFLRKGSAFFMERFKKYGNVFKFNILGSPTVRVSGAENVRLMVNKEPAQLSTKWPATINILLGSKSLSNVVGPEHPPLRKHLEKGFTPVRLADYFPCIQQHIQEHLQQWLESGEAGEQVIGYPACEDLIADIILEVVLGCRKEDDKDGKVRDAFKDINNNLFSVPMKIPFGGFSKALCARQTILQFVGGRMSGEGRDKDHVSLMDILLSLHCHGEEDEEKVKDNAVGLLIAGSSSTSGAMTCLLHQLGKYPDVLEKVREELRSSGITDSDAELSYSLLQKLEYVQCVVKESLRQLPPVGGLFRKTKNEIEVDEYRVPKDWTIIYSIRDTHQLTSDLLPDGDAFNPSRWLKQQQQQGQDETRSIEKPPAPPPLDSVSCNYIPFGSGPRMCLGRHLAQMILQVFIVELALTTNWTAVNPDSPFVYLPVTKPSDDLPLLFKKL